jgi:hypothetical protein
VVPFAKVPARPVGIGAVVVNGITIRKSEEIPPGMQAFYQDGMLLGVDYISNPFHAAAPGVHLTSITLNPLDYEVLMISEARAKQPNKATVRRQDKPRRWVQSC